MNYIPDVFDDEDEVVADDWEELLDEQDEVNDVNDAFRGLNVSNDQKNTNKSQPLKKRESVSAKNKKLDQNFHQSDNSVDDLLRRRELVEVAERKLADDLFSSCSKPDFRESLNIAEKVLSDKNFFSEISYTSSGASEPKSILSLPVNKLKDIEILSEVIAGQFLLQSLKSICWHRFLSICLRELNTKMSQTELKSLSNKVSQYIQNKRAITSSATKNKYKNDKAFEPLKLKNLKEVEEFAEELAERLKTSSGKSPCWLRFFDIIMNAIVPEMEAKDLTNFESEVSSHLLKKSIQTRESREGKRKPNVNSMKNYLDEMEMFYGDASDSSEEDSSKSISDDSDTFYEEFINS